MLTCAPSASKRLTTAALVNVTATGSAVLPGIARLSSTALPVVLTLTLTVPVTVTPEMPTRLTVPSADSAYVPPIWMSPTRPSESRTPVASGFGAPLARRDGPWPRKIERWSPANTLAAVPSASVRLPNVTLPSMVTKSAMFSVRSEMETAKTFSSPAPNWTCTLRAPSWIVSSAVAFVVLTRSSSCPPAAIGPAATLAFPDR
jgi:hypothetical protein